MYLLDLNKIPVHKLYDIDETGTQLAVQAVELEDIKAAPIVNQEDLIPHGFWVTVYDVDGNFKGCSCSECNQDDDRLTKYCGSCGARMDKKIGR